MQDSSSSPLGKRFNGSKYVNNGKKMEGNKTILSCADCAAVREYIH